MRVDAIGIMVEDDNGGAHHDSVCTLGLEYCTHCSDACTESDLILDGLNVDEVVHGGAFEEFFLN